MSDPQTQDAAVAPDPAVTATIVPEPAPVPAPPVEPVVVGLDILADSLDDGATSWVAYDDRDNGIAARGVEFLLRWIPDREIEEIRSVASKSKAASAAAAAGATLKSNAKDDIAKFLAATVTRIVDEALTATGIVSGGLKLDPDELAREFAARGVRDWRGMTLRKLALFLPIHRPAGITDAQLDAPLVYNDGIACRMLRDTRGFQSWFSRKCRDARNFSILTPDEAARARGK